MGSTKLQYGDSLHLYGKENNIKNGILYFTDLTFIKHNIVFKDMMIGNYTSMLGDSGGSIIHMDDGTANIVGMHQGTLCTDTHRPYNKELAAVGINGIENFDKCPSSMNYSIFSPWENIVEFYDLD